MAGQVTRYAQELNDALDAAGVPDGPLAALVAAAEELDAVLDGPAPPDPGDWADAVAGWRSARSAVQARLPQALLGSLADVPGLSELVADVDNLWSHGVRGEVDIGPVHLSVAGATLVVQPPGPALPDTPLDVGPFRVGQIAAELQSPFGSGMPGGGSIVELPLDRGYGGTLELPFGVVQVSAAAVLAADGGEPSFLAILGVTFTPPIQLSFGFSLDRVGGIVGVNRRADVEALRSAVRTGTAGDVLFATRPPASPLELAVAADRLFPPHHGTHLVGPSLRISWLSFGDAGSLISLDVGVVVELPSGRVVILGVARVSIPGAAFLMNLRLDLLGIIDPVEELVSIDASLVDSHLLGIFQAYGDAAARFAFGTPGYTVVSIGGFFPGFNPEPARLPALRRIGLSLDSPVPIISIRAEGYFATTSNTIQLGGRLEVGIDLIIEAHGFVEVDALVQFRPFHFEVRIAAGFDVSVEGFSFASVTLEGTLSGPGPIVIRGSLSISVFLFSISWSETFTLGNGPTDTLPTAPRLIDVLAEELDDTENLHADSVSDPLVVLDPRPTRPKVTAVPPTGTLRFEQRRAPLGLLIERVDGRPLDGAQGCVVQGGGPDVTDRFSPGSYVNLSGSEALNRPPFDTLPSGRVLGLADPTLDAFPHLDDPRHVRQIVVKVHPDGTNEVIDGKGKHLDLTHIAALTTAARLAPATSDRPPLVTALPEPWVVAAPSGIQGDLASATAAYQEARHGVVRGVAVPMADVGAIDLAGV